MSQPTFMPSMGTKVLDGFKETTERSSGMDQAGLED